MAGGVMGLGWCGMRYTTPALVHGVLWGWGGVPHKEVSELRVERGVR